MPPPLLLITVARSRRDHSAISLFDETIPRSIFGKIKNAFLHIFFDLNLVRFTKIVSLILKFMNNCFRYFWANSRIFHYLATVLRVSIAPALSVLYWGWEDTVVTTSAVHPRQTSPFPPYRACGLGKAFFCSALSRSPFLRLSEAGAHFDRFRLWFSASAVLVTYSSEVWGL